jgi:hypothetical protein
MAQSEWKKKWSAEYNARPEVKEKKRLYAERAENKLKEKLRKQKYNQRPEIRERNRLLSKQPHRVAKRAEYEKTERVKQIRRLATKRYKEKNPDKVKAWTVASNAKRKEDPEFQNKRREYENKNREKILNRRKERLKTEIGFKLKTLMRSRVGNALKQKKKNKTIFLLGCDASFLKNHLESQFLEGMCWENWSKTGWHIDHIVPFGQFNLSDPIQQIAVCNWRNLRPLWAKDNHEKTNKLTEEGAKLKERLLDLAKKIHPKECSLTEC